MAAGDIAASGMSAADIANLIGLVSPPGSSTKNVGEQDTSTTKGATNSSTTIDPSKVITDIGASTSTTNIGSSSTTNNIGASFSTQVVGPSHSRSVTQDHVDEAGVNRAIQQILEGSQGLAATAAGQHISGGYNSTTDMLLKNDLAARTAGTVSLLNKSSTTTTDNSGYTTTQANSGSQNITQNSGSQNTQANSGSTNTQSNSGTTTNTKSDPVTDIVKNAPYNINTTQVAQVSGKVAAGIAAGSLVYNALGQVVSKATGALVDSVTGSLLSSGAGAFVGGSGISAGVATGIGAADAAAAVGLDTAASAGAAATVGEVAGWDLLGSGAGAAAGIGEAAGAGIGAAEIGGAAATVGEGLGWGEALTTAAEVLAWIICTELCKQNRLNKRWYFAGAKTFSSYSEISKIGYYIWAIPCVLHLRKYPNSSLSKFLEYIFNWRAEYIAHNAGVKGARKLKKGMIVSAILYPTCCTLGHVLHFFGVRKDYHVVYK